MNARAVTQNAPTSVISTLHLRLRIVRGATLETIGEEVLSPSARDITRTGKMCHMDALDREILAVLQRDGRLSITELAERVGLTVSPCHRRLRALERTGVVSGYRAVVDPIAVGLTFEALVLVTMQAADRATVSAFEDAVAVIPGVVRAQRLFGDPDYLLQVVAADLAAFQELYDEQISTLPGVQRLNSTLVMKSVVDRPVPL